VDEYVYLTSADAGIAESRACRRQRQVAIVDATIGPAALAPPPELIIQAALVDAEVLHDPAFVAEDGLAATAGQAIAAAGLDIPVRAVIRLRGDQAPAGWADLQHWIDREGTPPPVEVGDDDLLRLMYTSGTESRPKGAMLSSRSLMWQYVSCVVDGGMTGDDIEVHAMSLYHCAQLDCFLGPDIYLGATSVVLPAPDPAAILAAIEAQRATKLFCPPTM
jgi:fatty-acyl-CoA synthase